MNPSSIIAVDKYEILYASAPEWDKENNIADQKKVIQYLNNASVQYGNIDLKINIKENLSVQLILSCPKMKQN